MKSFTAVSVLATALAALAPGASAANCYGSATWGSVQEYQTTASAICRGSESYTWQSDCQRGPVGGQCCTQHEAWFKGTRGRRDYCWVGFLFFSSFFFLVQIPEVFWGFSYLQSTKNENDAN